VSTDATEGEVPFEVLADLRTANTDT